MPEQDINKEYPEMPSNDMSPNNDSKLVTSSSVSDVIASVSGVDPSRFWMVIIILIGLLLAGSISGGLYYLIDQNKDLKKEIVIKDKELKDCPQKTLEDLKKQSQAIDDLKNGFIYNGAKMKEMSKETSIDIETWKKLNKELDNEIKSER